MDMTVGGQRKARETVPATLDQLVADPRLTESGTARLDRSAIPLIYSARNFVLKYSLRAEKERIATTSAHPVPESRAPARTGATVDAGKDPKGTMFYASLSV